MKKNYRLLLGSQFLSAFGDNAMLAVILGPLTFLREAGRITEQQVNNTNALYSALFFIPFILLAPVAGFLNDRYPKTTWLLGGNLIKLLGVLVGALGVAGASGWQAVGYCIVGVGACAYSPAKYGILPEILPRENLVKANGAVEMLTLAAILTGLGAGAKLVDKLPLGTCYLVLVGIYGLSLGMNLMMDRTPANAGARLAGTVQEFLVNFKELVVHPRLGRILFGCGLFWFIGATLRTNLQSWGLEFLKQGGASQVSNTELALLKVWMAVGIIVGSVMAGRLHAVGDLRGTRLYAWLMAGFILPLGFLHGSGGVWPAIAVLVLSGVAAGLFLVPLNASLQAESNPSRLGKTISIQNVVDYIGMLVGAGFVMVMSALGLTAAQVFIGLAVVASLVVFALRVPRLPEGGAR